jgi:hypothetical protein
MTMHHVDEAMLSRTEWSWTGFRFTAVLKKSMNGIRAFLMPIK